MLQPTRKHLGTRHAVAHGNVCRVELARQHRLRRGRGLLKIRQRWLCGQQVLWSASRRAYRRRCLMMSPSKLKALGPRQESGRP